MTRQSARRPTSRCRITARTLGACLAWGEPEIELGYRHCRR